MAKRKGFSDSHSCKHRKSKPDISIPGFIQVLTLKIYQHILLKHNQIGFILISNGYEIILEALRIEMFSLLNIDTG